MSKPCYTGGAEALRNNANALEQLVGAKTFAQQRELVNRLTSELDKDFPTVTEDNFRKAFADVIAREEATGGSPDVYRSVLKLVTTKDKDGNAIPDVFPLIQSVMLHQHAYTQGIQVSTHRVVGLAEQITNAQSKRLDEKTIKGLELEMIEAEAQLQNYMAHRSAVGTGLSFAFAQRQAGRIEKLTDSLNSYVESYAKNYKDAFEGEDFLQGIERNRKTREVMEQELKDLANDADMSPHVQAAKDAVKETQADLDDYLKTRKAGEEGTAKPADEGTAKASDEGKPKERRTPDQTEVDLQAKVKAAKEDVTQLARLKELQDDVKAEEMGESAIQAEIDSLKKSRGKTIGQLRKRLAKLKEDASSTERPVLEKQIADLQELNRLKRRRKKLKNENKPIDDVEAKIGELRDRIDNIKGLNKLEQTLARLKNPKSDIKKTKEEIEKIKKAREEAARRRIEASEITSEAKYKKFINQTLGSRDARTLAKRITFAEKMGKGDESARNVTKIAQKTGFRKVLDMGLQWFTGSLLSGPPTVLINVVTPHLSRTLQQLELAAGAALNGDLPLLKASLQMHNLFYGVADAVRMGNAAWKMDKDAVFGGPRMFDDSGDEIGAWASSNWSKNAFLSSQPMAKVMDTINVLTRLPNRINGSADTLNKTMASMQYLRTHFAAEAIAKKIPRDQVEQYVNTNVKKMFNKDGSLYSEARVLRSAIKQANDEGLSRADAVKFQKRVAEIVEKRIKDIGPDKSNADVLSRTTEMFARESTFTDEPGEFTKLLKQGLDHMPIFKFNMPFVSTPMNILHFGWRRTLPGLAIEKLIPLVRKTADQRKEEWANLTPMQQAAVKGRTATAVAATSAMTYFAYNHSDRITGGGPRNRKEREALMATGWRPYSFVLKNEDGSKTYVSYERLDPLATMIGIVADAAEFTRMNPNEDDGYAEVFSALAFTIAENMTDKSFLRGVNNIINIAREPEIFLPKTFKDIGSAMVVPMFVDKLKNANGEQMLRESRTLADAILRKVPIAEENVPPRRNFLGEAIYKQNPGGLFAMVNPLYIQTTKNDLVDEKIQGLLYGFSMPSTGWTKGKETDMREFTNAEGRQAYDRMLEITSEHKIYGRTLRQALKALFKSPAYQEAEQNVAQFGVSDSTKDPRVQLTQRIISRYRRVAKHLVIKEFPELQQAVRKVQQRNYQLRTGQSINPIPSL